MSKKTYLGDSVYAEWDKFGGLRLTTENGIPDNPSNEICLDEVVLGALLGYLKERAPLEQFLL